MNIEIIEGDIIHNYIEYMTTAEFIECESGKITCFGAYDEETEEIMGVLSAEVYPEFISIKRIFVCPDFGREEVESALLDAVTDLPDEIRLPIYVFGTEDEIDEEIIEANGFMKLPSNYSYIEGQLKDFINLNASLTEGELKTLDKIPPEELENFIFHNSYDDLIQMPGGYIDMDRFSEGSLVLLKKHLIDGAILIEESDKYIQIPYIFAEDNRLLLYAFFILKKLLFTEYAPGAKLRFLICNGVGADAIKRIIRNSTEHNISIFKFKEQD